jgi:hypothetical protein
MSLADDADKLFNRVPRRTTVRPSRSMSRRCGGVHSNGLCLLAQPAQPFEHAFLPMLHGAVDRIVAALTFPGNGWRTREPSCICVEIRTGQSNSFGSRPPRGGMNLIRGRGASWLRIDFSRVLSTIYVIIWLFCFLRNRISNMLQLELDNFAGPQDGPRID